MRMCNKSKGFEQQQAATKLAEATRKQANFLTANLYKGRQGDKEMAVSNSSNQPSHSSYKNSQTYLCPKSISVAQCI